MLFMHCLLKRICRENQEDSLSDFSGVSSASKLIFGCISQAAPRALGCCAKEGNRSVCVTWDSVP